MDIENILLTFNRQAVDYLLLGGVNFLFHKLVTTYDVDIWIEDTVENHGKTARALQDLEAEWGPDLESWKPTPIDAQWLQGQSVFCLTTRYGSVDIFREVKGLEGKWKECRARAPFRQAGGASFYGLSDEDMLTCQLVLDEADRKLDRIRILQQAIAKKNL